MSSRTVPFSRGLAAAAFAVFAITAAAEVPEPQSYWMGPMHGEVPAALSGARVLHAPELAVLLAQGQAVLIDAAAAPRRPDNLAPEAIWKPVPHRDIAGSIWLPDLGAGQLTPDQDSFYRARLMALTANDLDRAIVFYCHPQCWASWNAAKRAIGYGYRRVAWYPDGAEGWQDAGHKLVAAAPEVPPQAGH
ncbi:MAG TPA: rhodanese-like domain-containing protein [Methylocella sp.]|nr:rhodanese-like domain-containing protein [Methylocella sp.]